MCGRVWIPHPVRLARSARLVFEVPGYGVNVCKLYSPTKQSSLSPSLISKKKSSKSTSTNNLVSETTGVTIMPSCFRSFSFQQSQLCNIYCLCLR
jgi:hypothetical protein